MKVLFNFMRLSTLKSTWSSSWSTWVADLFMATSSRSQSEGLKNGMPNAFLSKSSRDSAIVILVASLTEISNWRTYSWTITNKWKSSTSDSRLVSQMTRRSKSFAVRHPTWLLRSFSRLSTADHRPTFGQWVCFCSRYFPVNSLIEVQQTRSSMIRFVELTTTFPRKSRTNWVQQQKTSWPSCSALMLTSAQLQNRFLNISGSIILETVALNSTIASIKFNRVIVYSYKNEPNLND